VINSIVIPSNFKVRNIVVLADIGSMIDIEKVANRLDNVIYEPEQFPGAIFKLNKNITTLLYASGKIVILGLRNETTVVETIESVIEKLKQ
jgi:transcription initiation factor TFIID TATA-box-binding protein